MEITKSEQRTTDVYADGFAALIDQHLEKLNWRRADLIDAMNNAPFQATISPVQISRWTTGARGVARGTAARVALVLALEFEKRRAANPNLFPALGLDNLDWMLQTFLNAAGYPGNLKISLPTDIVWNRIQDRKEMEVAYAAISPWAKEGQEVPTGPSIDLARRVIMLLGCKIKWKKCTWEDLPVLIRERQVDIVVPILMNSPDRLREYRFSKPVSKRRFGLKLLALKAAFQRGKPSVHQLGSNYQLGYVAKEIGEIACSLMPAKGPEPVRHRDWDGALAWVSASKQGVPRVLASEESTCDKVATGHLVSFQAPEQWDKIKFGICFGAHPDERKLINAIDHCLPLLEDMLPAEFLDEQPTKSIRN